MRHGRCRRPRTAPRPRPKGCPKIVDWGQGLIVGKSGKGHLVCAGDTALSNGGPTLAYGKSRTVGRFKCTSKTSGMTCKNTDNGHGYVLSKQKYRLLKRLGKVAAVVRVIDHDRVGRVRISTRAVTIRAR